MSMTRKLRSSFLAVLLIAGTAGMMACGDDDESDQLTLSGIVLSIDGIFPVYPAKVYVLDHPEFSTMTEADGTFSLDVDAGTPFQLVTDDADETVQDEWYPTLNFEPGLLTVTEDVDGITIHACPQEDNATVAALSTQAGVPNPFGTLNMLNNFLANGERDGRWAWMGDNIDSENSGHLALLFVQSPPDIVRADPPLDPVTPTLFTQNLEVEVSEAATFGPAGYTNVLNVFNGSFLITDQNLDGGSGNIMLPAATPYTAAGSGFMYGFGNPDYEGDTVTMTFQDVDGAARDLPYPASSVIPVRPDLITFVGVCMLGSGDPVVWTGPFEFKVCFDDWVAKGYLVLPTP